ncbi:MAG TPA: hypothetical protein VKM55_06520 [Candidatus Lokiarchaeia archaeon]|nr:hypothetical protein [Candidatus Lokiarchaeia archaeon]
MNMGEFFKIAYIGAGAHRFSMGLFRNFVAAAREGLAGKPIHAALVDIDERVLTYTTNILKHMAEQAGVDMKVTQHLDQREAIEDADFLYKSISVGAQAAEWFDIYIPQKFGIPQNTGDTIGPGGFFRGLRCAAPVNAIAKDMAELCPKAVMLNYTNPQATIVKTARRVDKDLQFIGLCHELFGGMNAIQHFNNTAQLTQPINDWNKDLDFKYVGVNHFAWLLDCTHKDGGEDVLAAMRDHWQEGHDKNIDGRKFAFYLLNKYGAFPYPGCRHVAEFMPEYFNFFNHEPNLWGIITIRDVKDLGLSHRYAIQRFSVLSRDFAVDKLPKPTAEGEHALQMTEDFINGEASHHHVCNLPNQDQQICSNLPDGAILEIPGHFEDGKMHGMQIGTLDEEIASKVRVHCEVQDMTIDAWEKSDPELLLKGLLHDPMCAFIEDEDKIRAMMNLMLYYEAEWLPTFKESIPSRQDLENSEYWVETKDLSTYEEAIKVKFPPDPELKAKCLPGT